MPLVATHVTEVEILVGAAAVTVWLSNRPKGTIVELEAVSVVLKALNAESLRKGLISA